MIASDGTGKILEEPVGKGARPDVQDAKLARYRDLGGGQVRSVVNCWGKPGIGESNRTRWL
jgi:hypothetical protein